MKPRKPEAFRFESEIVATCSRDWDTEQPVIRFDAVWELRNADECRRFRAWLDKAIAWRDAE